MNYTKSKNDVVNEYIANLPADVQPLFLEVREAVLKAGKDLNESIKWKDCLVYATSKNHIQTVVGKGKVSLIFFDGVEIKDDYGLLEGDGKKSRTMRINSQSFDKAALADYVSQAIRL